MKRKLTQLSAILLLLPADFLVASEPDLDPGQIIWQVTSYLESGDLRSAEQTLRRAHAPLTEDASAELANAWGSLHLKLRRFQQANAEFTAALNQTASNSRLRPYLLHNLAAVEMQRAKYHEAQLHEAEAIRLWKQNPPPEQLTLIKAYASLATAQYLARDPSAAYVSIQIAIWAARQALGPEDPLIVNLQASAAAIRQGLRHSNFSAPRELFPGLR